MVRGCKHNWVIKPDEGCNSGKNKMLAEPNGAQQNALSAENRLRVMWVWGGCRGGADAGVDGAVAVGCTNAEPNQNVEPNSLPPVTIHARWELLQCYGGPGGAPNNVQCST